MRSPEAVRLADLLHEIDAAARLAEFTETPDRAWYSIRIEMPGEAPKSLVVPKALVLTARTDLKALQTLRNILRAEVRVQRARNAIPSAQETLTGAEPESICPGCSKPIQPGETVRFEHGEVLHFRCER